MTYTVEAHALQATPKTLWCFLKLSSDDGFTGWGEFTINFPKDEIVTAFKSIHGQFTDSDFSLDGPRRGPAMMDQRVPSAIYTALDQAVFDLHAQRQGWKLVHLLAPECRNDSVALYANINRGVVERTPEAFAARAVQAQAAGFKALKMAPFDGMSPDLCQSEEGRALLHAGSARIEAVRDAIGPEMSLMVDCHWRFDVKTANEALGFLTDAGVSWYECPLEETMDAIEPLLKLRAKANERGMRLAGCEKFTGWAQFQPFVENAVYDVIMPDAKYAGGMREIMSVGERAMQHGVAVSLHNPSGPISHAVSLHIAVALDNGMPLEFQFNETPLFDGIADGVIPPRTGRSTLPDGIGIGIGLLEDRLTPLASL
jgi:galactonate dehydratase